MLKGENFIMMGDYWYGNKGSKIPTAEKAIKDVNTPDTLAYKMREKYKDKSLNEILKLF